MVFWWDVMTVWDGFVQFAMLALGWGDVSGCEERRMGETGTTHRLPQP